MENLFGSIDLTKLGQIVRSHPEAVKKVQMKDGTEHQFININLDARKEADQYGRTHYIKASIKKDAQKSGVNYFIADLKPSQNQQAPVQPQQSGAEAFADNNDAEALPF